MILLLFLITHENINSRITDGEKIQPGPDHCITVQVCVV